MLTAHCCLKPTLSGAKPEDSRLARGSPCARLERSNPTPSPKPTPTMRVNLALLGVHPNEHGAIHMTPECMSLDLLEGCIKALQDELDLVRTDARRAFIRGALGRA